MKSTAKNDPSQLTFAVFAAPVVVPHGDGSVTVRPGRPMFWLSPKEFGQQLGRDRNTIYQWIQQGIIEERFVEYSGRRHIRISAEAVPVLKQLFKDLRTA